MISTQTHTGDGSASLRERQRHAQEEAILAAAHTLIVEKGFEATTMEDIADSANISKPTLYARFPNKEAIVIRAVVRMQKEGLAFIQSLSTEIPPTKRLRTILQRIFIRKFVERSTTFGAHRTALTPQIRANPEYQINNKEIVAALVAILEEGQQDGSFLPDCPPRIVAQTMFSFVRDSEIDELITHNIVSAEAVVETLTEIILRGIEKR